jgi:PAS domain S-box-containing protein
LYISLQMGASGENDLIEYKHFFLNSFDLTCIANMQGHFEALNPNWEKLLGYSQRELIQNQFFSFIHPDDIDATRAELAKLKSGSLTINFVNRYKKKDNGYLWFEWNATPIPETGKIYAIARDITHQKRATADLRAIFDSALVSIIKTDTNGIITHFNRGAEILLGYKAEELIGKYTPSIIHEEEEMISRANELTQLHDKDIRGFDVFVEYAKQGGHESRQWTYVKKDGAKFPVQLVVTAIKDDSQDITGFLGIATDISDLKRAKGELEILVNHLQKQNNQLLHFAYVTSHNLRSPVSNLTSLLQFYKESSTDDDKNMLLRKLETVIVHLNNTLNELIDTLKSKYDLSEKYRIISFGEIFEQTKEMLIGNILETGAKVTADFTRAEKINYPPAYLQSVMLNLLSNAIKYRSPERLPEIHFESDSIKDGIVLTARDNGVGIDLAKYRNDLFGLYKTFHRHSEAKGVGLYITKTQVEALGGQIDVDSRVDMGSTFIVTFNKDAVVSTK